MRRIDRFVQLRNPKSKMYVKVDRKSGMIVGRKRTPYKNIWIKGQVS